MNPRYLLDTCIISELIKKHPDRNVTMWLSRQEEDRLFLSVLTLGELEKGISKLPKSHRRKKLSAWVSRDLAARFEGKLLPIDEDVARAWGQRAGAAERRGRKLPVIDSLLAATAIVHDLQVATRNTDHIEQAGVVAINPWNQE